MSIYLHAGVKTQVPIIKPAQRHKTQSKNLTNKIKNKTAGK
jgi:hypothetical protein